MTEQEFRNFFVLGLCIEGLAGVREPVAYLYNGVVLPNINEVWEDKETYPYAFIRNPDGLGGISFSILDKRIYVDSSVSTYIMAQTPTKHMAYKLVNGKWEKYQDDTATGTYYVGGLASGLWWSSIDVPNVLTSNVYLAATEPIPVYE